MNTDWKEASHADLIKIHAQTLETLALVRAERDRLATDALCILSANGIPTPEDGYVREPWMLALDIKALARQRDDAIGLNRVSVHGSGPCLNCDTGRVTLYAKSRWCFECQMRKNAATLSQAPDPCVEGGI